MAVSLEQFVQHLTQSGLMSVTDISSFQDSLPPEKRPKDGEAFARALVQANRLTKYQAQAIYQGKTKGLVFGDYRVLDKLGQGGMGLVLKAEHRRMKRLVAVKMIAGAALKSPDAVKRFYREVEAAAKLMHPNIVAAHDACEHDGVHYLVMEYVEGKDLGAIVKERGSLPIPQVVDYMIQAAKGLQYAHKQNIVHRDIKPANLLVDKEGTVKILDMGLARIAGLADQDDKERLTASGQVMGTCDYMAPEQALDTHHVDVRADIYSLGCTLYRLLAGDSMYKGDTLAKILIAHQMAPVPSLRSIRTDVPPQLDAVFQKMVAKKPEDRYQTMAEVIAELETCIGKRAATSTSGIDEATADLSSEDELAFLKSASPRSMATGVKKKVEKRAEATLPQQVEAAETSKQLGSDERLLGIPRKRKTLVVAIGLGLLGVIGVVGISWFAITIRIRHPDGKETVVTVPEGSQVTVSKGGDVDVTVTQEEVAPAFKGGLNPELAARSQQPSPFLGSDGNWKLPPGAPPPAVAPFDAVKAKQHQEAWAKHLGVPVEQENSIGMKLVLIPPGEFEMGSTPKEITEEAETAKKNNEGQRYLDQVPSEGPQHRVNITKPFYMAKYPVTQGEYEKVMGVNPSAFSPRPMVASAFNPPPGEKHKAERQEHAKSVAGKDTRRHPVEWVSLDDAMEFCRRLSASADDRAIGRIYRLPTEAEWEYACRAGTTTRWSCGDDEAKLHEVAWFNSNSGGMTHPVGEKKPDAWGLYDMHGNVSEWCSDWYSPDYYRTSPRSDPTGPPSGDERVFRGGSWYKPRCVSRTTTRQSSRPSARTHACGFRVVCEIYSQAQPTSAVTDDAFVKEVASLPPEQQVARVVAKLKDLNPGYDGKEEHKIENGEVVELTITNTTIKDISPLRALVNLRGLRCGGVKDGPSPLADITALKDLPLEELWLFNLAVSDLSPLRGVPLKALHCTSTKVTDLTPLQGMPLDMVDITWQGLSDLSPLRGMPLTKLCCFATGVKDFSLLKGMPLKDLRFNFDPQRDTELLRSIKTLETINGLPVVEFWKQVEAGKIPSPRLDSGN